MELKDRIVAAMAHAQLTQDALGKKVGLSQQSINKLVTGKALASRKLTQIAIACGVNPRWLAEGVGDMVERTAPAKASPPDDDDWSNVKAYAQAIGPGWAAPHHTRRDNLGC